MENIKRKTLLFVKPKEIRGKAFIFGEEVSNMKDIEEIYEEEVLDKKLEDYDYVVDCCAVGDENHLYNMVKPRVSRYGEDILFINEPNFKYINFNYLALFERALYLPQEVLEKNRIFARQEAIINFITKIYNSAMNKKMETGTTNEKILAMGVKINELLKINSSKEYVLVNDLSGVVNKANTEYITLQELGMIGEIQKRVLLSMKA